MGGKTRKHTREDEHQVALPDRTAKALRESLADDAATRASTHDAGGDVSFDTDDAATATAGNDEEVATSTIARTTDGTGAPTTTRTFADILAEMSETDSDKTVKPTDEDPEGEARHVENDRVDGRALTVTSVSSTAAPMRYNGVTYSGNQADKAKKLFFISRRISDWKEEGLKFEYKPKNSTGQAELDMKWGRDFVEALWYLASEVTTSSELNQAIADQVKLRDRQHRPDFGKYDRASVNEIVRAARKLREARVQQEALAFNDEDADNADGGYDDDDDEKAVGSYADTGGDGDYEAYEYRDYEAQAGNMVEDDEDDEDEDDGYSADLSSDDEE